ncbi:MAG: hypothetical protein HQM09_19065 [Candidatus Riflebacteria bacterium]|nr:hypothetical protein [Candidatus Riflebacteria bacterium]
MLFAMTGFNVFGHGDLAAPCCFAQPKGIVVLKLKSFLSGLIVLARRLQSGKLVTGNRHPGMNGLFAGLYTFTVSNTVHLFFM